MKKKLKWIILAAALAAAAFIIYSAQNAGVSAQVQKLEKGEIRQYIEDNAQVKSQGEQTVYIEGSGKITDIKVDAGAQVRQGDLLLCLDKGDLELQLKNAQAAIEAAKAQLKGTELVNYANKIELARVAVTQAENGYRSAKRNLDSARKMYDTNALSKEDLQKAQDAFNAAATALDSARLQLSDLQKGTPEYVKSGYQAQLEQAVVNRDAILKNIEKQEVRAPIDGMIIEKLVDLNSPASPATPAFTIGSMNALQLETEILADDANKVRPGQDVEISGKPLGVEILKGRVTKVAPAAKTVVSSLGVNQKRVPVTIEIAEKSGLIKPGYDLDIKIITEVKSGIIKVPDSAVFSYKGSDRVFLVENGKAVLRKVKKGVESGNSIEITEGLNEGETILVKPDNTIKEGVRIKPADIG